jgi:hypothetical protein
VCLLLGGLRIKGYEECIAGFWIEGGCLLLRGMEDVAHGSRHLSPENPTPPGMWLIRVS